MSDLYQSLSHSKWDCKYHVVSIPKRRQVVFGKMRPQLGEIFHMSLLHIFAATQAEARALQCIPALTWIHAGGSRRAIGTIGPNHVEVFITGVGPAAAREACRRLMERARKDPSESPRPDAICVIGTCGSLVADLPEKAIVIYNSCILEWGASGPGRDNPRVDSSPALVRRMAAVLAACGIPCEAVIGVTSPKVAARRDEKLLLRTYGARVVDMETYEILSAAHEASIPCVALRVVSDSLDRKLPDFTPAIKADGEVDVLRAGKIAMRAPISTARLIVAHRRALHGLSHALDAIFVSDCFGEGG